MKCIKEDGKYRTDEIFYLIGKILFVPFFLFGFWFAERGFETYGSRITCAIRDMCGLPCPGCGGTRAFYYLFKGNFLESLRLNATVIYGVAAYLQFMLLMFSRKHVAIRKEEKEIQIQYYLYGTAVIIIAQWLFKIVSMIHRIILS